MGKFQILDSVFWKKKSLQHVGDYIWGVCVGPDLSERINSKAEPLEQYLKHREHITIYSINGLRYGIKT